jgi:hypothetical protein
MKQLETFRHSPRLTAAGRFRELTASGGRRPQPVSPRTEMADALLSFTLEVISDILGLFNDDPLLV